MGSPDLLGEVEEGLEGEECGAVHREEAHPPQREPCRAKSLRSSYTGVKSLRSSYTGLYPQRQHPAERHQIVFDHEI